MKTRNIAIDIAKAIGIILMIIGHCDDIPYRPCRHFIFTFHMPLFFILSGYFFKRKDIKTSLINDTKHLMIPYFTTCAAVILITLVKSSFTGDFNPFRHYLAATFIGSGGPRPCLYFSDHPGIGAIWFFPALLVCKNVYNLLSAHPIKKRLIYSCLIYVIATLIGRYIIFIPFSVLCGLSAIIFYAIGDYYKEVKPKITWLHWLIGIVCWGASFKYSHIYLVHPRTDLYFIDVIGATTATLLTYKLSDKIAQISYISDWLSWLGRNSMYILCFHLIDINTKISTQIAHNSSLTILIVSMLTLPIASTWIFLQFKNSQIFAKFAKHR